MSTNFSIKFKYFLFLVSLSFFNLIHSNAQITAAPSNTPASNTDYMAIANTSISETGKLIKNITTSIGGNLVILLSSVAFVLFLWGLVRFIYDRSNGADKDLEKDKRAMSWGLAALFVIISVWGVIKMFQGFLGIENSGDIVLPKICVNGNCDKKSGAVSPGGGIPTDKSFDSSATDKLNTGDTGTIDGSYDIESIRSWTSSLKAGTTGNSVEIAQLQQFLLDKNYNLGSAGVDGKFGPSTKAAVMAFQKDNALAQDGIVGKGTKAVILYRHMGARPEGDTYYVEVWPNIMTSQSTDANTNGMVSNLQSFLYQQGYDLGNTGTHGIDGKYGGKTSTAVKAFQAKYYLKEDNLVGPSTKAVIMFVENGNK